MIPYKFVYLDFGFLDPSNFEFRCFLKETFMSHHIFENPPFRVLRNTSTNLSSLQLMCKIEKD